MSWCNKQTTNNIALHEILEKMNYTSFTNTPLNSMRMSENIDSFGRQLEDILSASFWVTWVFETYICDRNQK